MRSVFKSAFPGISVLATIQARTDPITVANNEVKRARFKVFKALLTLLFREKVSV